MKHALASLCLLSLALAACASTPAPPPASGPLAQAVMQLDRSTNWTLASTTPIPFDTHHPQGMVRIGGDWFVSSVEILKPTTRHPAPVDGMDRDAGEGAAHLFRLSPDGALKADLTLGEGAIYHPGGIDFDGRHIWVPVAEYRPDSRSIIYRVDPETMSAVEVLRVPDHIGAIVHDVEGRALIAASWSAARLYRWPLQPDGTVSPEDAANIAPAGTAASHYIAWQDCHGAGARLMLCTGLANYPAPAGNLSLGGVELIDLATLRPLWQTPIPLWSPTGRAMTQNPAWFEASPGGLRAWFMPDDDTSTLFEYVAGD